MSDVGAVRLAVELLHVPALIRTARSHALPDDVERLLAIAAGDAKATEEAVLVVDRPPEVVRKAAGFFIEQILLCHDNDSYRILGANPGATAHELRRNLALLLRYLHPDVDRGGEGSLFAARVTRAWEDLKTAERRAAYDEQLHQRQRGRKRLSRRTRRPRRIEMSLEPRYQGGFIRRTLSRLWPGPQN